MRLGFRRQTGWRHCVFAIVCPVFFSIVYIASIFRFQFFHPLSAILANMVDEQGIFLPLLLPLPFSFPEGRQACSSACSSCTRTPRSKLLSCLSARGAIVLSSAASRGETSSRTTVGENVSFSSSTVQPMKACAHDGGGQCPSVGQ